MKTVYGCQYFTLSALNDVPNEIRDMYEKAFSMLKKPFLFNLIKIDKKQNSVTLAYYPHLDTHTHPYLKESIKISIDTGKIQLKKESNVNPVILHRIETMLAKDDIRIQSLTTTTTNEEALGMYEKEHILKIGRLLYWNNLCEEKGIISSKAPDDKLLKVTFQKEQTSLFGDMPTVIQRGKTAMTIKTPSAPTRRILDIGLINNCVFDWGCGNGRDTKYLESLGYEVYSYDKFLKPQPTPNDIDFSVIKTIICNYVINVIENATERMQLIDDIFTRAVKGTHILISARSQSEIEEFASKSNWVSIYDGYLTNKNTFQKGFNLDELTNLVSNLGTIVETQKTKSYVFVVCKKE